MVVAADIRARYPAVVYEDGAVTVFGRAVDQEQLDEVAARDGVIAVLN